MIADAILQSLIHPKTRASVSAVDSDMIRFADGHSLPILQGKPVLLSEDSLFTIEGILQNTTTTQEATFIDTQGSIKNYLRKRVLPSLAKDFHLEKRYRELAQTVNAKGGRVLVIGSGDKVAYYKSLFHACEVVCSDVHLGLDADCVIDAHEIPFPDGFFDLVFAAQVLEHTMNPWKVAQEAQRVTKIGGRIQMEAPQNYPYHGQPYDFFRFTFTGLRILFEQCSIEKASITESNAAMVGVTLGNYMMNLSAQRYYRQGALFLSRFMFGWLKYLDRFTLHQRSVSFPKGYAFTFLKDGEVRKGDALLKEYYALKP